MNNSIVKPTHTFTAIDFETATEDRNSICQTGVVRVVDGKITDQQSWLNQPPDNEYLQWFTDDIHGISAATTADKPRFDEVWPLLRPYIEGQDVVAHNGFRFDFPVLFATLAHYGIDTPSYREHDTYSLLGSNLASLCAHYGIALNHHDALSDARACAHLFMIAQEAKLTE